MKKSVKSKNSKDSKSNQTKKVNQPETGNPNTLSNQSTNSNAANDLLNDQKQKEKRLKYLHEHEFQPRDSYFETYSSKTGISNSPYKGFYNLLVLSLFSYIFFKPIHDYIKYGYIIKPTLVTRLFKDLEILIIVFPLFNIWSYLAFILQLLIKHNIIANSKIIFILQHASQSGIFLFTTLFCIRSNMCVTHMAFTVVQCMIHFFKMHSYTLVNRDYRRKYLKENNSTKNENSIEEFGDYPNNITFWNYNYFLRVPTFVYRANYPQTQSFRVFYFLQKSILAIFTLICCYHIYVDYLEPAIILLPDTNIIESIYHTFFPMFLLCFLMFYLIFDLILNAYAEITYFADREFYKDWWNSTDFEEFNRKWNKIVHEFLYQHVFLEFYNNYNLSINTSKIITFLFSAVLHEFSICVILRLVYPFLFVLMIFQLPVIYFTKKYMKNTTFGNYFFWFSIILGVNLIFIVYNQYHISIYGLSEMLNNYE